jgi:hypothetical protein
MVSLSNNGGQAPALSFDPAQDDIIILGVMVSVVEP